MPARRREVDGHARYLTFSCERRRAFFRDHALKDEFAHHLGRMRDRYRFRLFAWVVMPEHVHLLILPNPDVASVSRILQGIKGPFARRRGALLGQERRFWLRGGGYDRDIFSRSELVEKARYIDENPVRRGLVALATEYPWSSARGHAGRSDALLRLDRHVGGKAG